MKQTTLFENHYWRLESWGNGWAYTLTHKVPGLHGEAGSVFVQDDDAARFWDELEAIQSGPRAPTEWQDVCATLWDDCEYGAAAQPLSSED